MTSSVRNIVKRFAASLICGAMLLGCHPDMWNQAKYTALQKSDTFADGAASRTRVPGTVTYDAQRRPWVAPATYEPLFGSTQVPSVLDERFWTGKEADGAFVPNNYFNVTPELLARGKERFEITCAPCHGLTGDANGIIVSRGFPIPATYHQDRLREVEDGYIFDVITNGFGRMYAYGSRVQPEDRWAIAAYIRALQFSQNPDMAVLTDAERQAITNPAPKEDHHGAHAAEQHGGEENAH